VQYIIFIAILGVISSVFSSEFPFGAIIQNLKFTNIEVLLDQLSFGLGFLAVVCLIAFFFFRSLWMKKDDMIEGEWEEDKIED
jgi:hypothetical protein